MSSGGGSSCNAINSKRSSRRQKLDSTASDDNESSTDNSGQPGSWACTVCTFQNRSESFRCEICGVRKGTSTRKPRLDSTVVEQQQTIQKFVQQQQQAMMAQVQKEKSRERSSFGNFGQSSSLQDVDSPGPSHRSLESPVSGASTSLGPQSPSTSKTPTPQPTPPLLAAPATISFASLTPSPTSFGNSNCTLTPPSTVAKSPRNTPTKIHKNVAPAANGRRSKLNVGKSFFLNKLDQNSARTLAVTVNGVTVVITDYKLLSSDDKIPTTTTKTKGKTKNATTKKTKITSNSSSSSLACPRSASNSPSVSRSSSTKNKPSTTKKRKRIIETNSDSRSSSDDDESTNNVNKNNNNIHETTTLEKTK